MKIIKAQLSNRRVIMPHLTVIWRELGFTEHGRYTSFYMADAYSYAKLEQCFYVAGIERSINLSQH